MEKNVNSRKLLKTLRSQVNTPSVEQVNTPSVEQVNIPSVELGEHKIIVYSAAELRKLRSNAEDCPESFVSLYRSVINNRWGKASEITSELRSQLSDKVSIPPQSSRERPNYEKRNNVNQNVSSGDRTMSSWRSKGENEKTPERAVEHKKSWEPSANKRFNEYLNHNNPTTSASNSKNDMWDIPGSSSSKKTNHNADEQRRLFEKERQEILAGRKRDSLNENSQEGSYHKESDDIMSILVDETLESESDNHPTARHSSITDSPEILTHSPGDLGGGLLCGGAGPAQFSNSRSMTVAELMRVSSDHELGLSSTRNKDQLMGMQHTLGGHSYFTSESTMLSDKSSLNLAYDGFSNEDAWVSNLIDTETDTDILGQPINTTTSYSQYHSLSSSGWKPGTESISTNESSQLRSLLGIGASVGRSGLVPSTTTNTNDYKFPSTIDPTSTSSNLSTTSFSIPNYPVKDFLFPPTSSTVPPPPLPPLLPQAPSLSSPYPISSFAAFSSQSLPLPIAPALHAQYHFNSTLSMQPPPPPSSLGPSSSISNYNIDPASLPFLTTFKSFDAPPAIPQPYTTTTTFNSYNSQVTGQNQSQTITNEVSKSSLGQSQDTALSTTTQSTDKDKEKEKQPMKSISLNSLFSAALKVNSLGVVTELHSNSNHNSSDIHTDITSAKKANNDQTTRSTVTANVQQYSTLQTKQSTTTSSTTSYSHKQEGGKPRIGEKGRTKPVISNSSRMQLAKWQQQQAAMSKTDPEKESTTTTTTNTITSNLISQITNDTTTTTTTTTSKVVNGKVDDVLKPTTTSNTTNDKHNNNNYYLNNSNINNVSTTVSKESRGGNVTTARPRPVATTTTTTPDITSVMTTTTATATASQNENITTLAKNNNNNNNSNANNNSRGKQPPLHNQQQQQHPSQLSKQQQQQQAPSIKKAITTSTATTTTTPASTTTLTTITTPPLSTTGRRIDVSALFARAATVNTSASQSTVPVPVPVPVPTKNGSNTLPIALALGNNGKNNSNVVADGSTTSPVSFSVIGGRGGRGGEKGGVSRPTT